MASKSDRNMMMAIVVGGAAALGVALYTLGKKQAGAGLGPVASGGGTGAVISFQPDRRRLSGWGNGMGRTGAAVFWRRVG